MLRVFSLDLLSIIVYIKYMKTTKGENTMNIDKYAELNNKVDSLLAETNQKMHDLIEEYNESISKEEYENTDYNEIDTVDLDSKFDELADYIEDYS